MTDLSKMLKCCSIQVISIPALVLTAPTFSLTIYPCHYWTSLSQVVKELKPVQNYMQQSHKSKLLAKKWTTLSWNQLIWRRMREGWVKTRFGWFLIQLADCFYQVSCLNTRAYFIFLISSIYYEKGKNRRIVWKYMLMDCFMLLGYINVKLTVV